VHCSKPELYQVSAEFLHESWCCCNGSYCTSCTCDCCVHKSLLCVWYTSTHTLTDRCLQCITKLYSHDLQHDKSMQSCTQKIRLNTSCLKSNQITRYSSGASAAPCSCAARCSLQKGPHHSSQCHIMLMELHSVIMHMQQYPHAYINNGNKSNKTMSHTIQG
jgi:hypothetical protein